MNETQLLQEIEADLQKAGTVVYLEGRSDPEIFFSLLGVPMPVDGIHGGVFVKGLNAKSGSGGSAVKQRVELAEQKRYPGIYGVIDGDGEGLAQLSASFDAPFRGPCFVWKAYCIENLLVKTGWPGSWGPAPDWMQVLIDHAPYVALNRVYRELRESLVTLGLHRFTYPTMEEPLKTVPDVLAALEKDKSRILGYDTAASFQREVATFEQSVRGNIDEGHALVNGKWLVNVYAPRMTGKKRPDRCRDEWLAHATATGGLAEVRELWRRITGRAP